MDNSTKVPRVTEFDFDVNSNIILKLWYHGVGEDEKISWNTKFRVIKFNFEIILTHNSKFGHLVQGKGHKNEHKDHNMNIISHVWGVAEFDFDIDANIILKLRHQGAGKNKKYSSNTKRVSFLKFHKLLSLIRMLIWPSCQNWDT